MDKSAVVFNGNPKFHAPFTVSISINSSAEQKTAGQATKQDESEYLKIKMAIADSYYRHIQDQSIYQILRHPKGRVLLINNEFRGSECERTGSIKDMYDMLTLWSGLGFTVEVQKDITAEQISKKVEKFANADTETDVCVLIVMSHGEEEDLILGSQRGKIEVTKILNTMINSKSLEGKPKIILFQMCRGSQVQRDEADTAVFDTSDNTWIMSLLNGVLDNGNMLGAGYDSVEGTQADEYISTTPDVFLAFAAQPDHKAFRNCEKGSWFIQTIKKVFADHAYEYDVKKLMTMVREEVWKNYTAYAPGKDHHGGKAEIDGKDTFGRKKLFLFPGFPNPRKEN